MPILLPAKSIPLKLHLIFPIAGPKPKINSDPKKPTNRTYYVLHKVVSAYTPKLVGPRPPATRPTPLT